MNLHKNYVEQNIHGRRRTNNIKPVENDKERENDKENRMNFTSKENNITYQWNSENVHMRAKGSNNVIPDYILNENLMAQNFSNKRNLMNNGSNNNIGINMNYNNNTNMHTNEMNNIETRSNKLSGINEINRCNRINDINTMNEMKKIEAYSYSNQTDQYLSNGRIQYEENRNINGLSYYVNAHPILGNKNKKELHDKRNINYKQKDFRNDLDYNNRPSNIMNNRGVSNEIKNFSGENVSSFEGGNKKFSNSVFSTYEKMSPIHRNIGKVKLNEINELNTNNINTDNKRKPVDLQFVNRVIDDEEEEEEENKILTERSGTSKMHLTDSRHRKNHIDFHDLNKMNISGNIEDTKKNKTTNINNNITTTSNTNGDNNNKTSFGNIKKMEYTGFVRNVFDTFAGNTETKNDLNNIVKEKVANIVMNEIEKKIDTADTSYFNNQLTILRQYFDVTHSYVINKLFFILIPYYYIYKALFESKTYYVYAHFKKKLEIQKDKHLDSPYVFNHNNNLQMCNKNLKLKRDTEYSNIFSNKGNNKDSSNNMNNMNNINNENKEEKNDAIISNGIIRNNSNDINYVDYSNIKLFKADLYIPLMSVITYILLYTLTITAQKNNFTFNPDNLFSISSYIFLLIIFEATVTKVLFLVICRDINLSFLHILSFISYKFVIMCALIFTKIFFYFIYYIYMSVSDKTDATMTNPKFDVITDEIMQSTISGTNQKIVNNHVNSAQVFKNLNISNEAFTFNLYNLVLLLNSKASYRCIQFYFYITVSIQMLQIFKSIHLYVHDNSNLLSNSNIKRINVLILIFSVLQIFLCWILTPAFS